MNRHQTDAKRYLSRAWRLSRRIESRLGQIEALRALAVRITASYGDRPKHTGPARSGMEEAVIEILALEEEINGDMLQLVGTMRDIIARIRAVDNAEYQTVLELRYLSYMRWEEIAIELGYGIDNVYRLHRCALDQIVIPETIQ